MITTDDKRKIIDWITGPGKSKAIREDGDVNPAITSEEVEDFIERCYTILESKIGKEL